MEAPARIKAENKRKKERPTKMGEGDAQIALEEKGAVRRKRPERKDWVERKGRGKTNCLPPSILRPGD